MTKKQPVWRDYPGEEDGREHTVVGTVKVLEGFHSPQLDNRRDIFAYLPPSYGSGERRYPVIYMHDGQNLFDRATSFGEEWEVDQTLEAAAEEGLEAIVIGISNLGEKRLDEYSPWEEPKHGAGGRGDDYLAFIVETLKPVVDRDFRTLPEREHTGIAGSSMGGLISLYGFFHRPETFGFTGVMSPALWYGERKIFDYVEAAPFTGGKIYVDVGTREGREELADVRRLRDILVEKGYRKGKDFLYVVEMGGAHNEQAWARRLRQEMQFLLGAPASKPVEAGR
ncbi:MAG TPA: alpha/beta hydrolase-fold protein [Longimicrobiaceae bacterium]|nr:alpha/beta hydrolase-fold protein [Longimicrobiaceae bacterium]